MEIPQDDVEPVESEQVDVSEDDGNCEITVETDRYSIDPETRNLTATAEEVVTSFGSRSDTPVGSTVTVSQPYTVVDRIPDRTPGTNVEAPTP